MADNDFTIGANVTINDSKIDPGKDKNGKPAEVRIGNGTTISGSAIGHGAKKGSK